MRWVMALLMAWGMGQGAVATELEMAVSLKPARRQPASVDPARPLKPRAHPPGSQRLKSDLGRSPAAHPRMSPRRPTPILDIDISIKDE